MMKKNLLLIALSAVLFVACKDKSRLSISGKLANANASQKVFLYGMASNSMVVLDSTNLSKDGEFKFVNTKQEADFFRVSYGQNEYIVIAKNGDEVKIDADVNDPSLTYKISGGEDAAKLEEFNTLKSNLQGKIFEVSKTFEEKVAEGPDRRDALLNELLPPYNAAMKALNDGLIKFAMDNSSSLVSFYAISLVNPIGNEEAMLAYSNKVDDKLKQNVAVKNFIQKLDSQKKLAIGQPAPEFTINSIDGSNIKLSDYRGKYVLLDFWASWCTPCREENPNVVKAYQSFKDKNFTILGISLDKDKTAWSNAIKADGLTWAHAGELNDFEGSTVRLYQVEAIPSSFLVDPSGKIIAKNLRGEELQSFLSKTLSK
jgi:peroxiredoxin